MGAQGSRSNNLLPDYVTPAEVADHFDVPERTVKELLRANGIFAQIGQKMFLYPEHVQAFKELSQCPSKSTSADGSTTTGAPLPVGDFGALQERLTKQSRSGSRRKSKTKPGSVVSMDRGQT